MSNNAMERDIFCRWFANPIGYARPYILNANHLNMKQVVGSKRYYVALDTQKDSSYAPLAA